MSTCRSTARRWIGNNKSSTKGLSERGVALRTPSVSWPHGFGCSSITYMPTQKTQPYSYWQESVSTIFSVNVVADPTCHLGQWTQKTPTTGVARRLAGGSRSSLQSPPTRARNSSDVAKGNRLVMADYLVSDEGAGQCGDVCVPRS